MPLTPQPKISVIWIEATCVRWFQIQIPTCVPPTSTVTEVVSPRLPTFIIFVGFSLNSLKAFRKHFKFKVRPWQTTGRGRGPSQQSCNESIHWRHNIDLLFLLMQGFFAKKMNLAPPQQPLSPYPPPPTTKTPTLKEFSWTTVWKRVVPHRG